MNIEDIPTEHKLRIIRECNRLARGGKPVSHWGLCRNLETKCNYHCYLLVFNLSQTWKHFSGDPLHPIEGNYFRLGVTGALWTGKQGKLRRSLARHIAKTLKASI